MLFYGKVRKEVARCKQQQSTRERTILWLRWWIPSLLSFFFILHVVCENLCFFFPCKSPVNLWLFKMLSFNVLCWKWEIWASWYSLLHWASSHLYFWSTSSVLRSQFHLSGLKHGMGEGDVLLDPAPWVVIVVEKRFFFFVFFFQYRMKFSTNKHLTFICRFCLCAPSVVNYTEPGKLLFYGYLSSCCLLCASIRSCCSRDKATWSETLMFFFLLSATFHCRLQEVSVEQAWIVENHFLRGRRTRLPACSLKITATVMAVRFIGFFRLRLKCAR